MEQSKTCSQCKQIKPVEVFYKRTASKDGLAPCCQDCDKKRKRNQTPEQKQNNVARAAKWTSANPERAKAAKQKSAEKNRLRKNERVRAKYHANPEEHRLKARTLRANNKAVYDRHGINRRAIKRGNGGFRLSAKEIEAIRNQPCFYCNQIGYNELDHVVPLSRGGRHSIGNLVPACRFCNASKGSKFLTEWRR